MSSAQMRRRSAREAWKQLALWKKILIGMALGMITGLLAGPEAAILKPLGDLFLNAIKMLIIPLVFSSLIVGVTSMKDTSKMGRISLKAILLYLVTSAVSISLGLLLANILAPGSGMTIEASGVVNTHDAPSLVNTIVNIIPQNPVEAFAKGDILQTIVFALAIGIAMNLLGEKAEPVQKVMVSLAEIMYKLTAIVMQFAPYGVFGLMAWLGGTYGLNVLIPLAKVIGAVYLGCVILVYGVYSLVLMSGGLNPIHYFRGIANTQAIAFSTSSSSGALPSSIRCAEEDLGVPKGISSFLLPLGATINMNGTALYQGVTVVFVAQAFGLDLSFTDYLTIIVTATLAAVGTAGVPGAGLIMLSLVLSSVGLPLEGVALITGIDRLLDMARSCVNVSGDLMVATLVSKSEGELDSNKYPHTDKKATVQTQAEAVTG